MRIRSCGWTGRLGDAFGPGYPLISPVASSLRYRSYPYRLRSLRSLRAPLAAASGGSVAALAGGGVVCFPQSGVGDAPFQVRSGSPQPASRVLHCVAALRVQAASICGPSRLASPPTPLRGKRAVFERRETNMTDLFSTDTAMADAFASAGFEIAEPVIETANHGDDEREPEHAASPTAAVCDHAAMFGATPDRDEFDPREVWDEDDALTAVAEAFRILRDGATPDGFQLADERESLLWGFVNMLDSQTNRLDRAADKLLPDLRDLQRDQDGTEIRSRELELVTDRSQNLTHRRDAFEKMRDTAADDYRETTGSTWRPRRGSHTSQTGKLTSAAIDARDFMRARQDSKTAAHLPKGTLVAIAGGKDIADPAAVIARLDMARAKYPDMVLVHGGGPGVERIAAQWADRNGVHQVVCKPDWDRHGRAAPFRRNDELLNLLPKGVIAFPGSGITENLVDKARQLGIPVQRVAA